MTGASPSTDDEVAELCSRFRQDAALAFSRSPLYARLAGAIADDPAVARLLLHAPPGQRLPVLLFACVHWMLLTETDHELGRYYPDLVERVDEGDPYPAFRAFCARQEPRLAELLASRSTQTNEVGRCALLVPPLGVVHEELSSELALLDVGASAGLNLALDRYRYRYEPGGAVGEASPVTITAGTRGAVPVPRALPPIAARLGLDQHPIAVSDRNATAWLEACVWPDQSERMDRLRGALEIARDHPVEVRVGDAVDDLAVALREVASAGHPVVTTTWVLNYLTTEDRRHFLAVLDEIGSGMDLSWVFAESPALVPGLPVDLDQGSRDLTQVVLVRWRRGRRNVEIVADAHPHGAWLHWR